MAKEAEEKDSEKPQKKGGGKGLLLIVIILLLIVIIGGGIFYFLVLNKPAAAPQPAPATSMDQNGAAAQPTARAPTAEPGPIQAYPPFLVNLADPGGNRYLKITLSLELSKEKNFPAEVTAKEPKIKDIIISVLSSKTYDEISTTQGKVAMKQEILRRLNTIMSGGRIADIYITEFVVQ